MKIGVSGATGKAGQRIMREALLREIDVVPLLRNAEKLEGRPIEFVEKDIFELQKQDLVHFDAVINAFKPPVGREEQHTNAGEHLSAALSGTDVRYIVVGGAGSLFLDRDGLEMVKDAPDFPIAYKPTADAQAADLKRLQESKYLNWTFISPSAVFDPEGPRTGRYTLGKDHILLNNKGESYVSYADFAIAVIDELENPQHIRERFTVCSDTY